MRYFGILVAAGKMVQTEFRSQPLSRCSRGRWKNGDRRRSFRSGAVSWSPLISACGNSKPVTTFPAV